MKDLFIILLCFGYCTGQETTACDSQIYCDGPLLQAIQMAKIYPDGKTFVDMALKESPASVLNAFQSLTNHSKETLQKFISEYFTGPGEELEMWEPTDFLPLPTFLNNIKDPLLKDFGWDLCRIWKDLGRRVKTDVLLNPDKYSMIYLPNPFIVPGGRFRETFYWDSYWVIKGLLVCEMNTTVKGMLENFIHYINIFGFIPNGGRTYFTRRSQPPFFISMMYEYYKATGDWEFIKDNLDVMEQEYDFWLTNRSISIEKDGNNYTLNQYRSNVVKPRPESYYEDITTAEQRPVDERPMLYSNIVSACESGWDFSSRWFSRGDGDNLTLDTISTMDIIPVDLNSILCHNEQVLKMFYQKRGNPWKVEYYQNKLRERQKAIEEVLYNEDVGIWQDYSIKTNTSRDYFYISNVFPVFMNCTNMNSDRGNKILAYLKKHNINGFKGGVPTSLDNTGQQWDFPNGWSPLEQVMIWSLDSLPQTKDLALDLASSWINSNYIGWQRTRRMFEKYNVLEPGSRGGGGEYDLQEGFGWTNGVALDILNTYGDKITTPQYKYQTDKNCINGCHKAKLHFLILLLGCFTFFS